MRPEASVIVMTVLFCGACSHARQYELRGQVLAVDKSRREITIRHEDIRVFMPGMTMPFKVRNERLIAHRLAGDLVRATLVVEDRDVYLSSIEPAGHAAVTQPPPEHATFDLLNPGDAVPDARLIDQSGATVRFSTWRGKVIAVTFIYTRCPLPDFCPRMDQQFAAVQREAEADAALRGRFQLVSVSFDPDIDTPEVLREHARRVGADTASWSFVTGERDEIDRLARRFGVAVMREQARGQIVHNLRTAVIDPEGRFVMVLGGNDWEPSTLIAQMRTTVAGR